MRITTYMIKATLSVTLFLILCAGPARAQAKKQETAMKREVTLYNPYKPSLSVVKKMSFLPDMTDTVRLKPDFRYAVSAKPFQPEYTISPIKAAALLPDPLPKLYKSYVNLGFGNHVTPLAEISITNERSKKGAFGFYGRHFSTNDDITLENGRKVYGGYMDNDASIFGKKFFPKSKLEGSVDFTQKVRHAYGYDPLIADYNPSKDDIRMNYYNAGGKISYSSLKLDSADFYYKWDIHYNYFHQSEYFFQHNGGIDGIMAKSFKGYYVGAAISYKHYRYSDSLYMESQYIASINPFFMKRTDQWNFKLGFQALLDRSSILHFYPDIDFGFSIVPSYLGFFARLSGKLERNEPLKIVSENPYLVSNQYPQFVSNGVLYKLPDTDHRLVITSGIKGNTGAGGSYLVSASYSLIDDMLFYSNVVFPDSVTPRAMGNYFLPVTDAVKLLNLHAEMNGNITDKLSFKWIANYYSYTTNMQYAWNKPDWEGQVGLKYNLREKIIVGMEITTIGKRKELVSGDRLSLEAGYNPVVIDMPIHFNMNFTAEYRYSKILSFWARFNNVAFERYYEWAYYPSQKFIGMVGFTYSL
jgi:hypothetical protein